MIPCHAPLIVQLDRAVLLHLPPPPGLGAVGRLFVPWGPLSTTAASPLRVEPAAAPSRRRPRRGRRRALIVHPRIGPPHDDRLFVGAALGAAIAGGGNLVVLVELRQRPPARRDRHRELSGLERDAPLAGRLEDLLDDGRGRRVAADDRGRRRRLRR